jgi:hypothetical protein
MSSNTIQNPLTMALLTMERKGLIYLFLKKGFHRIIKRAILLYRPV